MITPSKPRVGLFITCLVNLFRPQVGFAAVKLLEAAGCDVSVPDTQTCCGQANFNNGDSCSAEKIARRVIDTFNEFDHVVVPSGSCAGMIKKHYPALFNKNPALKEQAEALAARTEELTAFLAKQTPHTFIRADYNKIVTYHDACSGLRELQIKNQPRQLLACVKGLTFKELPESESCCGFGGTFCVKYPAISNKMLENKVAAIQATSAHAVLSADLGCLMNIAGKLQRLHTPIQCVHIAEILADMHDTPAIGESSYANP